MTDIKRRPRSLKGAVLIMVVTILFILIVMLLATLAVVSSTAQRTYTKYEETQAYYTARSVLEVYIDEVLSSKESYDVTVTDPTISVASSTEEKLILDALKAGGFEKVAYEIEDPSNPGTMLTIDGLDVMEDPSNPGNYIKKDFAGKALEQGFVHQQELFGYLLPKYQWDPTLTAPGKSKPSDDRNWKLYSANEDKCYVQYEYNVPTMDSGIADEPRNVFDSDGKVIVKVELLRILYRNKSGDIISDNVAMSEVSSPTTGIGHMSTLEADGDYCVDWTQTYYRLKVTSTANIYQEGGDLNNEVSVSVILEPKDVASPKGFLNAMTSRTSSLNANHIFTVGGASADDPHGETGTYGESVLQGKYVYRANFKLETAQAKMIFNQPYECLVCHDGVMYCSSDNVWHLQGYGQTTTENPSISADELKKRPFIYCSGIEVDGYIGRTAAFSDHGEYADTTTGACDIIITKSTAGNTLDTYLPNTYDWPWGMDASIDTSKILYTCAQNSSEVWGDVYCDGDMLMWGNSGYIHGDVYCSGTVYVADTGKQYFDGNLYCGALKSTANVDASGAAVASGTIEVGSTKVGASFMKLAIPAGTTGDEYEITVPGSRAKIAVPLMDSVKAVYTYDANKKTPPTGYSVDDYMTADDMFKSTIGVDTASLSVSSTAPNLFDVISTGTVQEKDTNGAVIASYTGNVLKPSSGAFNSATNCYEFKLNTTGATDGSTIYIDATEERIQIEITGGQMKKINFIVVGDNELFFTMADDASYGESKPLSVWTDDIYNMEQDKAVNTSSIMYLGNNPQVANTPPTPNIYYFIGKNVALNLNGMHDMKAGLCGYVYGPYASFKIEGENGCEKVHWKYNQTDKVISSDKIGIFGSIVFGQISSDNPMGVLFIPNNNGGGMSGGAGTNIDWKKQKYLNS